MATLMFAAYCLRSEQFGIALLFSLGLCLWALQRQKYALAGLSPVLLLTKPRATALVAVGWTVVLTVAGTMLIPQW